MGRLIYRAKLQNNRPVLYTSHKYDTSDRLKSQSWQIGNDSFTESYTYDQTYGVLTNMTSGGDTLGFQYNSLKLPSKRTSPKLDMTYSYQVLDSGSSRIANRVDTILYQNKNTGGTQTCKKLKYTYDNLNNLTWIRDYNVPSGQTAKDIAKYTYDEQNQVTQEILPNQTSDYTYDTFGNIRSKKTTYSGGAYEQYTYTYGNAVWQDQLTAIAYRDKNGTTHNGTFTYDKAGNPLTYNNGKKSWTFTWKHGRQLATAVSGSTNITNTYDVDGIRESKTVDGVKHSYTTLSGKIVREAYGNIIIDYFYDNNERPYKMTVKNGTSPVCTGYFIVNLQGDVIGIIDGDGNVAVEYEYDAWGQEISHTTSGSYGSSLYQYNRLKYRGYYYDAETGFYYVSSRYYDPEVGRFISADTTDVLDVQSDLYDKNLYAYCDNNPVMRKDSSGQVWITVGIMAAGGVIGGVIGAVSSAVTQNALTGTINWKSVAVAGGAGFVSGAVAASPLGLGWQMGIGAGIGAASYLADCGVNKKSVAVDELIVATAGGLASGYIGGPGANQHMALTRTIQTSIKTTARMSTRKATTYAAKQIASTKAWRNNVLTVNAMGSSARFAAGTGFSNALAGAWTTVKGWFSKLFK